MGRDGSVCPVLDPGNPRILLRGDEMGYRIVYQRVQKRNRRALPRLPGLTLLCFFVFCLLVGTFWPEGVELLRETVTVPGRTVVASAFQDLAAELQEGISLRTAFGAFCGKLLP